MRDGRASDRHDRQESVQAGEVTGVGREQRQSLGYRGCCDEQVGDPSAWLAPGGNNRCAHAPEHAGCLGAERNRVELTLGALQYFQAAGAHGAFTDTNRFVDAVAGRACSK